MTLLLPQKFKPSREYARLPITVEDTKPYYVAELQINDTTSMSAKLMIDTGASHGLFLTRSRVLKSLFHLRISVVPLEKVWEDSFTGRLARIRNLRIGRYSISNMIASFPDPK